MLELLPIVTPNIEWRQYLSAANQALGVSVSGSFDAANIPPSPKAFVVSLNDLSQTTPVLELDVFALSHLSYSFVGMLLMDTYYELMETVQLAFTSSETQRPGIRVFVVSGNLLQWQQAVNCASNSSNPDIRQFAHRAKTYFEGVGLGDIWKNYIKTKLPDKTLQLTYRPKGVK
jgi:hypothetical protein